jgi:two-component system response regulator YesN
VDNPRASLAHISGELQVERHTIERAVKDQKGKSFREYQQDILLVTSLRFLSSGPNRSIKEIAYSLGYQSPRSFCRFIKDKTGHTPTQLRLETASL